MVTAWLERDIEGCAARFAAGAAHEINNPLAVISGRAQLLLAQVEAPEQSRALEALRAEVQRISTEQREALTALDALREGDVRVLNQRIDEAMLRVDNAVFRLADSIERRLSAAIDGLEYAAQMTRQADRQALLATVEDRVEALARLIRSDHEHRAAKVAAEQEAGKQALRSAKEVQASLPREIADAIDRRLAGFVRTLDA